MSGAWGVGCGWCAAGKVSEAVASRRHALIAENKAVGVAKQAASRFSTWSRYDAKKCLNAQNFARSMLMHERTDLHRIAAAFFHSPEAHLHQITWTPLPQPSLPLTAGSVTEKSTKHALQTSMSQAVSDAVARHFQVGSVLDPFPGCVPQEQVWIDLWAHSSSCISMLKQARVAGKKQNPGYTTSDSRRKMITIMAEVVREGTRKRLKAATSSTVALDDWKGRKLLRVRVDTPEAPYYYDGVLGIVRKTYGSHAAVADDITEDHARHSLQRLEVFRRRFLTPLEFKPIGDARSSPWRRARLLRRGA